MSVDGNFGLKVGTFALNDCWGNENILLGNFWASICIACKDFGPICKIGLLYTASFDSGSDDDDIISGKE